MKLHNTVATTVSLPVIHLGTYESLSKWLAVTSKVYGVSFTITRIGPTMGGIADVTVCGRESNVLHCVAEQWGENGAGQDYLYAKMVLSTDPEEGYESYLWNNGVTDDELPGVMDEGDAWLERARVHFA